MAGTPDIQICPLGSGSKGNCTFVGTPHSGLLIDGGFSAIETIRRLVKAGIDPARVQALLVTHEHSDHIACVGPLARRFKVPVYITRGTLEAYPRVGKLPEVVTVAAGEPFHAFVKRFGLDQLSKVAVAAAPDDVR